MRRLVLFILLILQLTSVSARQNVNITELEGLRREWKTMDSSRPKYRSKQAADLSDNVRERFVDAYSMEQQGRLQLAAGAYMEILDSLQMFPELYIHANLALSNFYRNKPAYEKAYSQYLMHAARTMANVSQIDPETYIELGNYLISKGFRSQGEEALNLAAKRLAEVGEHQTAADLTNLASAESARRHSTIWLVVCFSLAAAVVLAIYAVYSARQNSATQRNMRKREEMLEAEKMRWRAVTTSFILLSLKSMESLKDFNTYVTRKLAAGQAKNLYSETESGSYLQGVSDTFFDEFDELFLNSFPEFVEKVNELLKPDRRFSIGEENHISPELRIAAFMMLGISDTSKLAQVMNLSVNTIYTYRNRLRSRAIDRENFEAELHAIGGNHV